jgi:predicted acetyltransferase
VATEALREVARPSGVTVRRSDSGDADAVLDLYERWAREQNGPLTLRGPSFQDPTAIFASPTTAVSVAERDGVVVGYAVWDRGQHYGEKAVLEVSDLVAVEPDGLRALLRLLGSFASVAPVTTVDTSGDDLARLLLPSIGWTTTYTSPYMIKVLDVAGTLSALHYPEAVDAELAFTLAGDLLSENDGGYRLRVSGGVGRCERDAGGGPVFAPQGLAVLLAGAQSCANARFAGLLSGPTDHDRTLDALFGGRQPHIRTYY